MEDSQEVSGNTKTPNSQNQCQCFLLSPYFSALRTAVCLTSATSERRLRREQKCDK